MELAEKSVSDLLLAKGDMPLGLNNGITSETAHTPGLGGQKLELPIPSEAIIEPISPAEVTLEESELTLTVHESAEEETAGIEDPNVSQVPVALSDVPSYPCISNSVLDSNPTEPPSVDIAHTDTGKTLVGSDVTGPLDPNALDKEATLKNSLPKVSTPDSSTLQDVQSEVNKDTRKRIPPKKDRMNPLKMDMSKPTVVPITSSQMSQQCHKCHIIFSDNKSMERHLKMNHPSEYEQCMLGDSFFACYVCDQHFTCSTELMAHQRTHTEKQPFKCLICGEAFSRSTELSIHKKVHFNKHGYTCSDCGKPCKTLTLLKYHQRIHTGERPFVCIHKECGKRFSMPTALHKHLEVHEKQTSKQTSKEVTPKKKRKKGRTTKFVCSHCKEAFLTDLSLFNHIKNKHSQCKTITPSNSTMAIQEMKGNLLIPNHHAILQSPVLRMETIGPAAGQIGPLGAEQIKKQIEKLGNVQKVNQLVILRVDQIPVDQAQATGMQPPHRVMQHLHFNFTEPTDQPVVVQQTKDQSVHKVPVPTRTDQATCKDSLDVGVAVEQEAPLVQEETMIISPVNPQEQMAVIESDMAEHLNEVQLELVTENNEKTISNLQLNASHEESHSIEEQSAHAAPDVNIVETGDATAMISTNDFESRQSQIFAEEHVTGTTSILVAEEKITNDEFLGKNLNEAESLLESELQTKLIDTVKSDNSQDLEGQLEEGVKKNPLSEEAISQVFQTSFNNTHHDQESSCLEEVPSSQSVTETSTIVTEEQNLAVVKDVLHIIKKMPLKKKRSKKQVSLKSQDLESLDNVAKSSSQITPTTKTNSPSKTVPKNREKTKNKKLVQFQPKEKKNKCSKQKILQISKNSLLKDQQNTEIKLNSTQTENVPQLKQKKQKTKKGKTIDDSSGVINDLHGPSDPKVTNMAEHSPRGKPQKRKFEKDIVKKRKSEDLQQEEAPLPKKKKQSKTLEKVVERKAKFKNDTKNKLSKEIHKIARQGEKEQKAVSQDSRQDPIKQQALLLLKGHKQPQLKVHKLDAKATGLEQTLKTKCQSKEIHDQETAVVKVKGGSKNKALKTSNQKKKKTSTAKKEKKGNQKDFSDFQKDKLLSSPVSNIKPKLPRKRKTQTKIDQEIALSPPFSRLSIGCHDCGKMFSEVSALQEHMASVHSENGLYQPNVVTCDVSNGLQGNPRSNEAILGNAANSNNFEIQVSSDWDVETEMREVHTLSFPALNASPSFPVTSTFVEAEGKIVNRADQGAYPGHGETLGENSTETGQPFTDASSKEPDISHIQTNDKTSTEGGAISGESVLPSSVTDPQESIDIKVELPLDVNLVMVEDHEGDDHMPSQMNTFQESSGQQDVDSSHIELNNNATPSQSKLPVENSDPTSPLNSHSTEQSEIKQEAEETLINKENHIKTSVPKTRKGRGGKGRGKKQLGKRNATVNRGLNVTETDKDDCQVVFQLYSLTDDCEEKNGEREVSSGPTIHGQSAIEESSDDRVVFELQPVATRVVGVMKAEDTTQIRKSGQVKNGISSGVILQNCLTSQDRIRGMVEGLTSTGTSTDVKMEASTSIPASHDVHPRDLLQGVHVFLVKAEDHEPHVLQENRNLQTHQAAILDGIPSEPSAVPQSAGKQCIFYPVKQEEGEIPLEPPLNGQGEPENRTETLVPGAESRLEECEEIRMDCTQMEMDHSLYSSAEEDDADMEQQSTQGFLEFLSQSSDTEDTDNFQSEPEAETHIMSCYHGICTNKTIQQHEVSRKSGCCQREHQKQVRKCCKPIDYFIQYFSWDTWKDIATCTQQVRKMSNPVTEKEVAQFVGIHIAMGSLKFPSMKLYWEDCTRVPLIADAMSASRFSELSHNLRLVSPPGDLRHDKGTDPLDTVLPSHLSQEAQNGKEFSRSKPDPLWKVQSMVNRVQEGCRALKRHGNNGVDQYPLPFQRHPTHSLHHTVMINVNGLIMDFNVRINDFNREKVVEKMVSREKGDNQGMIFLCKPELSTPSMVEHLLEAGVRSAGKVGGARGQVGDEFMTPDGKLKLFRCHHGFILSAVTKEKSRSTSLVSGFERAIKAANLNRDLRSLYRTPCTNPSPSAWPLSVLWDLTDLALVNSWLQYKQDHSQIPEVLSLMAFRLEISKALILPRNTDAQESSGPYPPASNQPGQNTSTGPSDDFETPLPDATTRYDGLGHWPEQLGKGEEARCRFGGCERTSRVRCLKCCVFLCISRNHNCFLKFHSQGAA
ncbi:uncharacterized protein [Hoplias malabaricus]|uniref:uncharacterized protein n=1 Tax=Hoplias malabaricus TaxID=27720 RepID=UPI0034633B5C